MITIVNCNRFQGALAVARAGATVVLTGRRVDPLRAVAEAVGKAGGKAWVQPADVTKAEAVQKQMLVKYQQTIQGDKLKGLREFCSEKKIPRAYVITKELKDFTIVRGSGDAVYLHVPAVLACYWLSKSEIE